MSLPIVTLRDENTGAEAAILPSRGFNCYRFDTELNGVEAAALWATSGFDQGAGRPSSSGIPLLFPFPGRIAGSRFEWEGREHTLDVLDDHGNAIHGFVYTRPWRVTEQSASRVTGQFQSSVDAPEVLEMWPADFRITAEYEVSGHALLGRFTLENPDERPLPCGFGTHPYFRVPLVGDDASQCMVRLPLREHWELKQMLTTGVRKPVENAAQAKKGLPFSEMKFDDVYTAAFENGRCVSEVLDLASGLKTALEFDASFPNCVIYTPAHRQAICVEPYTCPPDPFRLSLLGAKDHGLMVLGPGESRTFEMTIRIQTLE